MCNVLEDGEVSIHILLKMHCDTGRDLANGLDVCREGGVCSSCSNIGHHNHIINNRIDHRSPGNASAGRTDLMNKRKEKEEQSRRPKENTMKKRKEKKSNKTDRGKQKQKARERSAEKTETKELRIRFQNEEDELNGQIKRIQQEKDREQQTTRPRENKMKKSKDKRMTQGAVTWRKPPVPFRLNSLSSQISFSVDPRMRRYISEWPS